MDKTEKYIKMCDCEEIQGKCKYTEGDVVHDGNSIEVIGSILTVGNHQATKGGYDYDFFDYEWARTIWLPRQDQLQGMLNRENDRYLMVQEFSYWVSENYASYYSMEQLWLAFVMKEKFNKTWDGDNWI